MTDRTAALRALKKAFPHTIPILMGFGFLGVTYGIFMTSQGFSFLFPMITSIAIFGGSLEFITVNLLLGAFNPMQALAVALMIQARHIFYGISMLDKYKGMGWKKPYMIFGLCDESFSINFTADIPEDIDRGWFMFWVTLLDQLYWVAGATVGGLAGSLISFNTQGIEFVMTAMFVVIFIEQLRKEKRPYSAIIGFSASLICLFIFGADDFLLPTMLIIVLALTALRRPISQHLDLEEIKEGGRSV